VATVILITQVCGCGQAAFGRTENYGDAWPVIGEYTPVHVEVIVEDKRPYVVSGRKRPSFVGLSRGGYGNPFNISTTSGQPLATDVEAALVNGFQNAGIDSRRGVMSSFNDRKAATSNGRLLLVTLGEWKSDTFATTSFAYDISGSVYDQEGNLLGTGRVDGKVNTSSGVDGGRKALTELLSSRSIVHALLSDARPDLRPAHSAAKSSNPAISPAPVADEIRKLKDLADEGIIAQRDFEERKRKLLAD
jgi:hypothetical protein